MSEEDDEVFEHLFDLPPESRMMIIDRMKRLDRIRFSQCSQICRAESFASKNYLQSIKLYQFMGGLLTLSISHGFTEDRHPIHLSYTLIFEENDGEKTMRCQKSRDDRILWIKDLESSESLTTLALAKTKELMDMHSSSMESLDITIRKEYLIDFDFGTNALTNLKKLDVNGKFARQLISKTTNPLTDLFVNGHDDSEYIADCPQLYKVRQYLQMPRTRFNLAQLLQLNATYIEISVMGLSEQDVFNYIELWKNRSLRHIPVRCEWRLPRYGFAAMKLFRYLNKPIEHETQIIQNETRKIAILSYGGYKVKFEP